MRFSLHNIASINGSNFLLLNRWWCLMISGVFYKSAGENYWSAMSSTNPRCRLKIRGVINKSAGVNYWSGEIKKNAQNRPKKGPKPKYFFCSLILVQWPNFLWKKFSHFTIPLSAFQFDWYMYKKGEKNLRGRGVSEFRGHIPRKFFLLPPFRKSVKYGGEAYIYVPASFAYVHCIYKSICISIYLYT